MNNNYAKEIYNVFSIDAINYMRKAIVDAYGNEVYFGKVFDRKKWALERMHKRFRIEIKKYNKI